MPRKVLISFLIGISFIARAQEATQEAPAALPVTPPVEVKPQVELHTSNHRVSCVAEMGGYHFNLKELSMPINQEAPAKSVMYHIEYQDVKGISVVEFNLCEKNTRQCPDGMIDFANVVNSVGTCNHLSRMLKDNEQKPGALSLISENNPALGVVMKYDDGNKCTETEKYSLTVQINCNPHIQKTTYALDKETLKNPCALKVIMNSPYACPVVSLGPLSSFIKDYAYWIGAPLILIGGYLIIFGGRFPGVTLAIFSTLSVALIQLFAIFVAVMPSWSPVWTVPVVGVVCLGMGLGMGYGAAKWPRIGVVIMGLSLGSLLGFLIFWAFLSSAVNTTTARIITVVGVALVTAILYFLLFDHMVIITSAIFGAYILIRGISLYAGGYVDEFTVVLATQNGDIGEVRWTVYLYWALVVIAAGASIFLQFKDRKQHLEAYAYKFHSSTKFESYKSMRDRISRSSGKNQDQETNESRQLDSEEEEPLQGAYKRR